MMVTVKHMIPMGGTTLKPGDVVDASGWRDNARRVFLQTGWIEPCSALPAPPAPTKASATKDGKDA